jgi:hypothetical protein
MKTSAFLIAITLAAPAQAMSVADFLQKSEALKARGALALFSSDLQTLKQEVVTAGGQLRAERLAAQKAGRKPAYCPPNGGGQMDSDQLLAILNAVPAEHRRHLQVKDALRAHFARAYPCKGQG